MTGVGAPVAAVRGTISGNCPGRDNEAPKFRGFVVLYPRGEVRAGVYQRRPLAAIISRSESLKSSLRSSSSSVTCMR